MSSGYAVADREGGRGEEERARGEVGRAGKNSPDVSSLRGGRAGGPRTAPRPRRGSPITAADLPATPPGPRLRHRLDAAPWADHVATTVGFFPDEDLVREILAAYSMQRPQGRVELPLVPRRPATPGEPCAAARSGTKNDRCRPNRRTRTRSNRRAC